MPMALPDTLQHPNLWQGRRRSMRQASVSSGLRQLDTLLPDGGWPLGALCELLVARSGIGELSLLLPLLAQTSSNGGWMILIDPPWLPYVPAMQGHGLDLTRLLLVQTRSAEESLWACEQALRGVRGGVVLGWLQGARQQPAFTQLRRLQLAARHGQKAAFLFRDHQVAGQATPASLRLHLEADAQRLKLTLLKGRGAHSGQSLRLRRDHLSLTGITPSLTPFSTEPAGQTGASRPSLPMHPMSAAP